MNQVKNNSITAQSPGKLLLCGDHAAVYGYPCIVTACEARLKVTVSKVSGNSDQKYTPHTKNTSFIDEALKIFRTKYQLRDSISIETASDPNLKLGLGSSSAVTVATLKALSELYHIQLSQKELFDLCYQTVLAVQKTGSGFDVASAVYGKTIYYIKGNPNIDYVPFDNRALVIGYSGLKGHTVPLVQMVAQNYKNNPAKYKVIFQKIGQLVNEARKAFTDSDYQKAGKCLTENHNLLIKIGVSTPKLNLMVESALQAGAYGAKLSGAGGGDCMIALVSKEAKQNVEKGIIKVNGQIINVASNTAGVRIYG